MVFGVQRYHTFESTFLFPKVREVTSVEGSIVNRSGQMEWYFTNLDWNKGISLIFWVIFCEVAIIWT